MAFGTGTHETTRLMIRLLEDYTQPGCRMLDVGTGTGILAICASRLGAGVCRAYDIDPTAVRVARENIQNQANQHHLRPFRSAPAGRSARTSSVRSHHCQYRGGYSDPHDAGCRGLPHRTACCSCPGSWRSTMYAGNVNPQHHKQASSDCSCRTTAGARLRSGGNGKAPKQKTPGLPETAPEFFDSLLPVRAWHSKVSRQRSGKSTVAAGIFNGTLDKVR